MQNHPQLEAPSQNGVVGTKFLFPLRIRHHALPSHSKAMERIWQTFYFLNQGFPYYSLQLKEFQLLESQENPVIKNF